MTFYIANAQNDTPTWVACNLLGGLGTIPKCRQQSEESRIVLDSVDAGFNIIFRQTDGEITASFLDGNGGTFSKILSNHFNYLGILESGTQLDNYDGSGFWSLVNTTNLGNGTMVCYGGPWPTHIFLQYDNGSVLLKMRIRVNGTWTDWARF